MKKRMLGVFLSLAVAASSICAYASPEADAVREDFTDEMQEQEITVMPETDLGEISDLPDSTESEEEPSESHIPDDSAAEELEEETVEDVPEAENEIQPEKTAEVTDNPEFVVFDQENAGILTAENEEDQEVIREIEQGEMVAFSTALSTAFSETDNVELMSSEEDISVTALSPSQYYLDSWVRVYCDEVWTEANDFVGTGNKTRMGCTYRSVHYIDDTGAEKVSPLYCLKATKDGMDSTMLKNEAIKVLKNSVIQKLLYFGFGGPGDLGTGYDPSCSHIDWSKWQNRYVFTHIALSKAYFNDRGYATEAEVEHVGVNRLINKLKSMTIPARNKTTVSVYGENGWISASGKTIPLSVFRSRSDNLPYIPDSMKDGFQMSTLMKVTDSAKAGNGIAVTRGAGEKWHLAYWSSVSDYEAHKTSPKMMTGTSLNLQAGAYFFLIFPLNVVAVKKFSYKMLLQPVSYILVDGTIQSGNNASQDFGAYVYQGTRGQFTFSAQPSTHGNIKLTKKEPNTGEKIAGAQYGLYAAEDLTSGYRTMYKLDQRVETGTTDQNGAITFSKLIPGKYYIKEIKAASGYKLNTSTKNVTVYGGKTTSAVVGDIMDISGTVTIRKKDGDTGEYLAGAEFTLYEWSKKDGSYGKTGKKLTYDSQKRLYQSEKFFYTADNQGKFQIRETKVPKNYTGNWQKNLKLEEPGTQKSFVFEALNYQSNKRRVEIRKIDAKTGEILKGAEFTLYEYSAAKKGYKTPGTLLTYDSKNQIYVSEELLKTTDNTGRFRVVETKIPAGYEGSWKQDINITDQDASLFFEAANAPKLDYNGEIRLKKTDVYTGEVLAGAEFTVYQWSNKASAYQNNLGSKRIMKYDSESGWYSTEKLAITDDNQGKFQVVETKNPPNYTGKYEKKIVFKKNETTGLDTIELEAENTPVVLPRGIIRIIKKVKEEDITWAHGNPTFFFVAEGKDLAGVYHRYEDYATFVEDSYSVDKNGYATVPVTIRNVPLGQYTIWEKPVLRYYLNDAWANTKNVKITRGTAPAYGIDPKEVATGTADLTMESRNASLTFVNEKSRYDRYSHNDCVKNTIPLLFS